MRRQVDRGRRVQAAREHAGRDHGHHRAAVLASVATNRDGECARLAMKLQDATYFTLQQAVAITVPRSPTG